MTVEELIEALRAMPPTSRVEIDVRCDDDDELVGVTITGVVYDLGMTNLQYEDPNDE